MKPKLDKIFRLVAQDCILLYRGFTIRNRLATATRVHLSTLCRMQFGDTAD
jgi:hypothetical protein